MVSVSVSRVPFVCYATQLAELFSWSPVLRSLSLRAGSGKSGTAPDAAGALASCALAQGLW